MSSFIAYKVQTIMMGSSVGLGLIMIQTMAKQMCNEMQFTWTDLKVGFMGNYNMGRRWVKGSHKLGRRTSQLVTSLPTCDARSTVLVRMVQFVPMNPHGITMMIIVAMGGRFTAGYVSFRKTIIHD